MRQALALLAALLIAACSASQATTTPSLTPGSTGTPAATLESSGTPPATSAPTIAPSFEPSSAPAPTLSDSPTVPEPTYPPVFGSATLTTTGDPIPNSDLGGCGAIWIGAQVYGADDCGPHAFNLDAEPVVVAPGGTLTFAAPRGYLFSIDQIASEPTAAGLHSWAIAIAPVSELEGLPLGEQESITAEHGGRDLGYGDREVISAWVKAPLAKGEYLAQLEASVNLGSWTWTWPIFFWRVSVR